MKHMSMFLAKGVTKQKTSVQSTNFSGHYQICNVTKDKREGNVATRKKNI